MAVLSTDLQWVAFNGQFTPYWPSYCEPPPAAGEMAIVPNVLTRPMANMNLIDLLTHLGQVSGGRWWGLMDQYLKN